jgi:hypothetical protein
MKLRTVLPVLLPLFCFASIGYCGNVTVAPIPAGEAVCPDYQLVVDGQDVPVYACRVSAVPFNQIWPGYQRPLDQTELSGCQRDPGRDQARTTGSGGNQTVKGRDSMITRRSFLQSTAAMAIATTAMPRHLVAADVSPSFELPELGRLTGRN